MKRSIILFLTVALTHALPAQTGQIKHKVCWFDLQIAQHIGLNSWSNADYVNNGFHPTAITEFRGVFNLAIIKKRVGIFADMGLGIMPAPKMQSLDLEKMPTPYSGTQYYLRETFSGPDNGNPGANFKMTFGAFGKIPANDALTIMPYLGAGFMTMPQTKYEVMLKEQGSNMQYQTTYIWNYQDNYEYGAGFMTMPQTKYEVMLKEQGSNMQYQTTYSWNYQDNYEYNEPELFGYFTGRLNFKYRVSSKTNLLFGLEYTRFFETLDFYGKYSNIFNENIEKEFIVKGNKVNMFGISVGISF